jgi:hypothetical protein
MGNIKGPPVGPVTMKEFMGIDFSKQDRWYREDAMKQLDLLCDFMQRGLHKLAAATLGSRFPYGYVEDDGRIVIFDRSWRPHRCRSGGRRPP